MEILKKIGRITGGIILIIGIVLFFGSIVASLSLDKTCIGALIITPIGVIVGVVGIFFLWISGYYKSEQRLRN